MTKIIALDKARRNRRIEGRARSREDGAAVRARLPVEATALPRQPAARDAAQIAVSVVVPTRGRAQLLNRCLASLALQRFPSNRFEIIVVDDGPDDATREVVAGWREYCAQQGPSITYIPSMGPYGPAAARNHGWRAARGAIVAFTEDDAIPRADWLRNAMRAFDDDVDALWGRVVMPLNGTPTDYELDAKRMEQSEFVAANCFCRKRVLEDIGGFDERFRVAWREDSDFHFRLLEYRAAIVHQANVVVMHPIRPARWGVSLAQVKKVQFDALLYKKHPRLYRSLIRPAPRWDFYVTVGALFAALGCLLAGAGTAALAFGMVWLAATSGFCLRRLSRTSKSPLHVAEMIVTSALIPPLAVFWRIVGALRFRVAFV